MSKIFLLVGFKANCSFSSLWKISEGDSVASIRDNITETSAALLLTVDKMKIFIRDSDGILNSVCVPLRSIGPIVKEEYFQMIEVKHLLKKMFGCNVEENQLLIGIQEITVVMEEVEDLKKEIPVQA